MDFYAYWGKAAAEGEPGPECHLLAFHSLDVAAVMHVLLERDTFLRRRLTQVLSQSGCESSEEELRRAAVLFAALHDLGKFSDTFQALRPDLARSRGIRLTGMPDNAQVTLDWLAPASNGGSPVTDYVVEHSTNDGMSWTVFSDSVTANTGATVTGLVNATGYLFRVAAKTAFGTGAYAQTAVPLVPFTRPGVPGKPTTALSNGLLTLSWTAPASDGGESIDDYVVEYSSNSGGNWTVFDDGVNPNPGATVTGLVKGTSYVFRVAATNLAGQGLYSNNSSSRLFLTPPSAPTITSGDPTNTLGSAHLVWTAPSDEGGAPVQDYLILVSETADFANAGPPVNPSTSAVCEDTVGSLYQTASGHDYWFKVAAKGPGGIGPYSEAYGPIKVSAPTLPQDVRASGSDPSRANLWWSPPAYTGGRTILGYSIQSSINGTNWFSAAPSTTASAPTFAAPLLMTGNEAFGTAFTSNAAGIRFRVLVRWNADGAPQAGPTTTVFTCDVSGDTAPHDNNDACDTAITSPAIPNGTLTLAN